MEALKQFLDAGGMAVIGVAVGAGLTYLCNALSRRHQEAREDRTRWYEAQFRAYIDLTHGVQYSFALAAKAKYLRDEPVSLDETQKLPRN